jgi:hypothetical protein
MDACRQNTARRFVVFRTSRDYVDDDDDGGEEKDVLFLLSD